MTTSDQLDVDALVDRLDGELRSLGDPGRAVEGRRYLRSDLEFRGVAVPTIRSRARASLRGRGLDHDEVVALVEALWTRRVHELRVCAVEVLVACADRLDRRDLPLLERLLREAGTWALVDPLAIGVTGGLVAADARAAQVLDRWVADPEMWVRRAALLALLRPLRAGGGDWDRFTRYADALLDEREPFIRKAIGWVLREVGTARPALVVDWLGARTHRASGVTVREAVRHLPPEDRQRLLTAHRAGRALG